MTAKPAAISPDNSELIQTSGACPEQYDLVKHGKTIAYFRLRHGDFSVECPDVGGTVVYEAQTRGDGSFWDDEERRIELAYGRAAVVAHYAAPAAPSPEDAAERIVEGELSAYIRALEYCEAMGSTGDARDALGVRRAALKQAIADAIKARRMTR